MQKYCIKISDPADVLWVNKSRTKLGISAFILHVLKLEVSVLLSFPHRHMNHLRSICLKTRKTRFISPKLVNTISSYFKTNSSKALKDLPGESIANFYGFCPRPLECCLEVSSHCPKPSTNTKASKTDHSVMKHPPFPAK